MSKPTFGDESKPLGEKLKSWKRWAWILATILPLIVEALTGELGWGQAIVASLTALGAGMGVIGWEDTTRAKASAIKAQADAQVKTAEIHTAKKAAEVPFARASAARAPASTP